MDEMLQRNVTNDVQTRCTLCLHQVFCLLPPALACDNEVKCTYALWLQ
jgi:hypothetical protein